MGKKFLNGPVTTTDAYCTGVHKWILHGVQSFSQPDSVCSRPSGSANSRCSCT